VVAVVREVERAVTVAPAEGAMEVVEIVEAWERLAERLAMAERWVGGSRAVETAVAEWAAGWVAGKAQAARARAAAEKALVEGPVAGSKEGLQPAMAREMLWAIPISACPRRQETVRMCIPF
jgi:hypothetical protein